MANFVPAGEDNSASKQVLGAYRPNFVPGKGFTSHPSDGQDGQFADAKEARLRARKRAKATEWDKAVKHLQRMTTASAAQSIKHMPQAIKEMHLLVEEATLNRSDVLGLFPPVGPTAREAWSDFAESQELPAPAKATSTTGKRKTT